MSLTNNLEARMAVWGHALRPEEQQSRLLARVPPSRGIPPKDKPRDHRPRHELAGGEVVGYGWALIPVCCVVIVAFVLVLHKARPDRSKLRPSN